MKTCFYPDCRAHAAGTFALVPLCSMHHDIILAETEHYYERRGGPKDYTIARTEYMKIAHRTPWRARYATKAD